MNGVSFGDLGHRILFVLLLGCDLRSFSNGCVLLSFETPQGMVCATHPTKKKTPHRFVYASYEPHKNPHKLLHSTYNTSNSCYSSQPPLPYQMQTKCMPHGACMAYGEGYIEVIFI